MYRGKCQEKSDRFNNYYDRKYDEIKGFHHSSVRSYLMPWYNFTGGQDVNKMLVEALLLVRACDNTLARQAVEQVLEVVMYLPVIPFLTGIVFLDCFIKKLMISVTQSPLNEHDVVRCSGAVYVPGSKLSVVM